MAVTWITKNYFKRQRLIARILNHKVRVLINLVQKQQKNDIENKRLSYKLRIWVKIGIILDLRLKRWKKEFKSKL